MTQMSTRRSAAAAARELMNAKMKAVEDLAASLDTWRTSRAAVDDAIAAAERKADDARAAHDSARNAGWTTAELRSIGLEPPALPRRRRSTTTGIDGATPSDSAASPAHEPAPSSDAPAGDVAAES